ALTRVADDTRGVAGDDGVGRHVFGHHGAGADQCTFADDDPAENDRTAADGGASVDAGGNHFPIGGGLRRAVRINGGGIAVIDEHDAVPDETLVLDGHAFADEGVAGNFAPLADGGVA